MAGGVGGASPARIALTFDNLGEAADIERGLWSEREPIGRHPSVFVALPWLLEVLHDLGLLATFCVEGFSCVTYFEEVREIADRGHEIALHGWQHERWDELEPEREEELLERGLFVTHFGERPGFRPPGGELTPRTLALLERHGFGWCSPARGAATDGSEGSEGGGAIAVVPFDWPLVDAYHVLPSFADLRERRGDAREPVDRDAAADRMLAALEARTGTAVLILHPFLMLDDAGRRATRRVLERAAQIGAVRIADVVARSRPGTGDITR